ncbi:hypothetical protein SBA4_2040034 [Candidatus Sulfopaludibacter sp. SbA4]|nr:hypothetical protein SBA4_2040034 [Candidatus Sulfopaludibacter sp. SbA4]
MEGTRRSFIQFLARGTGLLLVGAAAIRSVTGHMFRTVLPPRSVPHGSAPPVGGSREPPVGDGLRSGQV